ncbi:hypothetical protein [Paraburkholderia dinghuensis]|uniref:Uncharacterized protein n=1 Tax=Paraburkholderia dinghuensis TaxID=2305225 RepID=A0A3N6ME36_9BURK|nr:hypothetical protein [Paraburkholderia dinghuensis]RQG99074.1 hypothetical protein D1Y85_26725 [Paraburkholderia dinghuensis]
MTTTDFVVTVSLTYRIDDATAELMSEVLTVLDSHPGQIPIHVFAFATKALVVTKQTINPDNIK